MASQLDQLDPGPRAFFYSDIRARTFLNLDTSSVSPSLHETALL
jgi:hypothetical protein